jgi:GTPase SAR1 family protein
MHEDRQQGNASISACVLVTAAPAAGKTCLVSQLIMHLVDEQAFAVPILIKVQQMLRFLLMTEHRDKFETAWNWVDAYLMVNREVARTSSLHDYIALTIVCLLAVRSACTGPTLNCI